MNHTRIFALLCAVMCVFGLCAGASAGEIDSGSTYCFGTGDFSDGEITGICITDLPEDMTIPLIIKGKDFKAGKKLENVSIKDIAPTVVKLLDIAPDREWEGKSLF